MKPRQPGAIEYVLQLDCVVQDLFIWPSSAAFLSTKFISFFFLPFITCPMPSKPQPNYLAGYPAALTEQVQRLIMQGTLGDMLLRKYPHAHDVRTDKALYDYVLECKAGYLRNAGQLSRVAYDSRIHVIKNALGIHARISRVQGANLKTSREIRIAAVFREMPPEFLRMIVVHELAHIREREHNKAFYQLCRHMEPDYHQLEFDLRAYLCYLEAGAFPLWGTRSDSNVHKS